MKKYFIYYQQIKHQPFPKYHELGITPKWGVGDSKNVTDVTSQPTMQLDGDHS